MNYIGHKGSAVAMFPIMTLIPVTQNIQTEYELVNHVLNELRNVLDTFFSLGETNGYIMLFSLIFFWIGATIIDTIDFKLIRPMMSEHKQKYHYFYHRQWTHGLLLNLVITLGIFYLLIFSYNPYFFLLLFLSLGVWTHLLTDMISGSIPIVIFGNYKSKGARIGITKILPKKYHQIFTRKLPKYFDRGSPLLFFIGGMLFVNYGGLELIYNPLYENVFSNIIEDIQNLEIKEIIEKIKNFFSGLLSKS